MSGPFGSQQWMYKPPSEGFYPYEINNSLKFEDGDSSYLSRTPASAGTRTTWTLSMWVKRANISTSQMLFSAGTSSVHYANIQSDNTIRWRNSTLDYETTQVFRDSSAWYHLVFKWDTTNSTAADRAEIYVNNEKITVYDVKTNASSSENSIWNNNVKHTLGNYAYNNTIYFDGYMTEVIFIDGTALDPSSFGETKEGIWIPKDPTGLTYGTNGFRLPFTETTTANGFNTITFEGQSGQGFYGGVGFQPDFLWIKRRDSTQDHYLVDSVRGGNKLLKSNSTAAESTYSSPNYITGFESDGFTSSSASLLTSGADYVSWCWDAGTGSAASNSDGSITSTVKANQDYGFSIVSYTGTGSNATVGHGLGVAPKMIIIKDRGDTSTWIVYTEPTGNNNLLVLASNAAASSTTNFQSTDPTSSVFSISGGGAVGGSSSPYIAYCFADVTGYQKLGTYTGNGSASGPTVTLGFKPAFLLIKRTDTADNWHIADNTRSTDGTFNDVIRANLNNAESADNSGFNITYNDTGFTLANTNSELNASGGTYIYLAIADTRDALFTSDSSGNGNNWTPNALQHSDVMPDTPTDGFATLNSVFKTKNANPTFSEGNLTVAPSASAYQNTISTIGVSSGKWYAEIYCNGTPNSANYFGVGNDKEINNLISTSTLVGSTDGGFGIQMLADDKRTNGSNTTGYSSAFSSGDIMNIAMDLDNGKVWFGKNGTYFSSGNPAAGSNEAFSGLSGTFYVILTMYNAGFTSAIANFGQDSSFNANEIPQGNADGNGKGDFYYAPPSGYLALCNANLPDPAIDPNAGKAPEDYFNTVLYTGDATDRSITSVGFQPDFTWIKNRSNAYHHGLFDSVRGANKVLKSSAISAEATFTKQLTSFDTDGFSLGDNSDSGNYVNINGHTYVAWNWLAGGTGVSNTDGTITSTVSANTEAGFSIVTWTGNGTDGATVGHGLSQTPEMIIIKKRDNNAGSSTGNWIGQHIGLATNPEATSSTFTLSSYTNGAIYLNLTNAQSSYGFDHQVNGSTDTFVAYCFHNVEGYSKFGSYKGNGSSNGAFVYTGFRPAFVIVKRTDTVEQWHIQDSARSSFNQVTKTLYANLSNAESDSTNQAVDFVSNGLKIKTSNSGLNASSGTYIYMAFAEQPFKYSNAR